MVKYFRRIPDAAIEPRMVAGLLIRNCKTERFLIEILCPFQVIEIKFNPDESRSDWLHRMSLRVQDSADGDTSRGVKRDLLLTADCALHIIPWNDGSTHSMRKLIADLFISLDGFASGVHEAAYFGYFGPDLGNWVRKHLDERQVILMGRVTYEILARFSASAADEVSARMSALPKMVCSSTLREPLAWKNTSLIKGGAIADEIKTLMRCIGSIRLVRSLVKLGLVDRLRLMVFPLILGENGKEPIYTDYPRLPLELVNTTVLDSRLILLEYNPVRAS